MRCNVSKTDARIRALIGVSTLVIGWLTQSWWGLIGLLPLYTITVAWCPKQLFCATSSNRWWHRCCE